MQGLMHFIKNNKVFTALLVGVVLILLIVIWYFLPAAEPVSSINNTDTENKPSPFYLVSSIPTSGFAENVDAYATVIFQFSLPINPNTVSVKVEPSIPLATRVLKRDPRYLYLTPTDKPWIDGVSYKITVSKSLSSLGGDTLEKNVELIYLNRTPSMEGVPVPD